MSIFWRKSIFIFAFFICNIYNLLAQDPNLAAQYYADGEYEKAASLYGQLAERDERNDYFFNRYIDCLLNLSQYEECEKVIKKQIKRNPDNAALYVTYGSLFDRQGREADANLQYDKAIARMAPDYSAVQMLANTFVKVAKYDYAAKAYERGAEKLKDRNRFAYNLGELYRRKGDSVKMIEQYLHALSADAGKLSAVQTLLARYLAPGDFPELQKKLYARIETDDNPVFIEVLAWSFIQRKDYKSALRQVKALDKKLDENGRRVFELASDAANSRDYETAIAAYDYIATDKGATSPFFFDSKRESMECRRKKITEGYSYTQEELRVLESDYDAFLTQYGKGKQTAPIILNLADLEVLYLNSLPKAVALLEQLKEAPGIDRNTAARAKINLADYYLISGDRWESTLLYSQVDKEFKEEHLGQEARFKNARLSYYHGDFQWAQAQFDVLKSSTSKLISNDAIDLSVFIQDNLTSDSTGTAIRLYAGAELMAYQNKFADAFLKLDTLRRDFPDHSLQDDILYIEGQLYEKQHKYEKAAELYQQVYTRFPQDIRADNALYAMAQLYETRLSDPEKAKGLYEKIFIDYSGSVFAIDARKRFRVLRGDKVQ